MATTPEKQDETFLGNGVEIYLFIMDMLLIIFSFACMLKLIYSLSKNPGSKLIKLPTISGAIFYFLSSCLFLFALGFFNENDNNNFTHDHSFVICIVLFMSSLIFAKLSIYTQFLGRLYAVFKDSVLTLNNTTIRLSISLLILYALTVIWWIILIFIRFVAVDHELPSYYIQFFFIFLILFLCDFILSWLVVGLFINKLYKSIMFRSRDDFFEQTKRKLTDKGSPDDNDNDPDDVDVNQDEDDNEIELSDSLLLDVAFASIDDIDQKRLDLITRQFILSILSISITQIVIISFVIILIIIVLNPDMELNQTILYGVYGGIFYPFDVIFNFIALIFNFKFGLKYYYLLCKCCHARCKRFVVYRASKKILRQHSEEIRLSEKLQKTDLIDPKTL